MTHVEVCGLRVTMPTPDGGERAIVDDVSFAVPRGEVLALIGESGSGKTTIALALMGHVRNGARIAGGTIRIGETQVDRLDEDALSHLRGRRVAYVAQSAEAAFNPSRTIMAQVIEPVLVHGLGTRAAAKARAVELFRAMALPMPEAIGARYPHQLSGGQLQRLMGAMALITAPELLILDEPTTALDVVTQVEVLKAFKAALAISGATAIHVGHDLAVVAQLADRVLVLRDGRVREQGAAAQVLNAPQDDYTRSLLAARQPAPRGGLHPADAPPLLEVAGVGAAYGRARVLRDVSFTLFAGAAIGVIGESGSGKSTLARTIAGLLPRDGGTVRLAGKDLPRGLKGRSRDQFRRMQMVFQNADTALNPAQDVATILSRPLAFYHGVTGAAARALVAELLDLTRLPATLADRQSGDLSGGQKQRVNLARALAAQPDVLLCDEVTSGLDTVVGAAIVALIADLRRELGIATVFISHDISNVLAFCDTVMVLYDGTVVERAEAAAFARGPHHPYTTVLMKAVPAMEAGWLERATAPIPALERQGVAGDLCRFLARCPVAIAGTCDRAAPPLRVGHGQQWLCHRPPEDFRDNGT